MRASLPHFKDLACELRCLGDLARVDELRRRAAAAGIPWQTVAAATLDELVPDDDHYVDELLATDDAGQPTGMRQVLRCRHCRAMPTQAHRDDCPTLGVPR